MLGFTVAFALACSRQEVGTTHTTSAEAAGPAVVEPFATTATGKVVEEGNRDTGQVVRMRLLADPAVAPAADHITITALGNTVTLEGSVPSEAIRQRAVAVALTALGVSRIDDRLRVSAPAEAARRPTAP
jgi:hypothetical protein